jgi:short-subunit dehydrogenase
VDVVVNNAGYGQAGAFNGSDAAGQLGMIDLNDRALVELTHIYWPSMLANGRGGVLNVASTAAFQPGPLMAVYYATKAYVLSFSEAIADELKDSGVTVTALCPGPTATGFGNVAGVNQTRLFTLMKPATSMDVAKAGYEAMKRGKRVVVTGMMNRLLVQSVRVSPRRVVTTIVRKLQESRL